MEYKRLEIYVGWTCNQKCTYCMEFPNMEKNWNKKVTKYEILKKLIIYKKLWYNHVTYLWWEPFIQWVFLDALKLWKKLWFTRLVTTNASTLHLEKQASLFLPYINELILSVEAIDSELQQKISRTKVIVSWEEVFNNIDKYWKGSFLKVNIVITKDNLSELYNIVEYVIRKWVKNIAITYPDIDMSYYGKQHILEKVAPTYTEAMKENIKILILCEEYNVHLKLPDFPFCVFPKANRMQYITMTDDYDYGRRLKIDYEGVKRDRLDIEDKDNIPRERRNFVKCDPCIYKWKCWWPSIFYNTLYWLDEIIPII